MNDLEKLQGKKTGAEKATGIKTKKEDLLKLINKLESRIKQLEGEKDNPAMKNGFKRIPLPISLENLRELQNEHDT